MGQDGSLMRPTGGRAFHRHAACAASRLCVALDGHVPLPPQILGAGKMVLHGHTYMISRHIFLLRACTWRLGGDDTEWMIGVH